MNRNQYNKDYYTQHKGKILSRMNSKVHCPICNTCVSKVNLPRHMRTKKHKKLQEAKDFPTTLKMLSEQWSSWSKANPYKQLLQMLVLTE